MNIFDQNHLYRGKAAFLVTAISLFLLLPGCGDKSSSKTEPGTNESARLAKSQQQEFTPVDPRQLAQASNPLIPYQIYEGDHVEVLGSFTTVVTKHAATGKKIRVIFEGSYGGYIGYTTKEEQVDVLDQGKVLVLRDSDGKISAFRNSAGDWPENRESLQDLTNQQIRTMSDPSQIVVVDTNKLEELKARRQNALDQVQKIVADFPNEVSHPRFEVESYEIYQDQLLLVKTIDRLTEQQNMHAFKLRPAVGSSFSTPDQQVFEFHNYVSMHRGQNYLVFLDQSLNPETGTYNELAVFDMDGKHFIQYGVESYQISPVADASGSVTEESLIIHYNDKEAKPLVRGIDEVLDRMVWR